MSATQVSGPINDNVVQLLTPNPIPRRFQLVRNEDVNNFSGTGVVATGIEWPDGYVAMHWNTLLNSTTIFPNINTVESIHGHDGATVIRWID